jgi:hypothetical protein
MRLEVSCVLAMLNRLPSDIHYAPVINRRARSCDSIDNLTRARGMLHCARRRSRLQRGEKKGVSLTVYRARTHDLAGVVDACGFLQNPSGP